MTDFFARLEARYQGEAGVLRPRVPFRFEPVSASLAAADLTGGAAAADPGWRGTHPGRPFRRPGGAGRPGEPWADPAAGDGGQPPAGPEPEPAMAGGPISAGLRPVRPARPLRDQAADADLSGTGRADGAASGGTWRAGQGPGPVKANAMEARQEVPSALDRAAVLEPTMLEPAEQGAPAERQAVAWTAEPGTGEPGTAAWAAEQVARREWRSGPGGDPDEADAAADADAVRSRRRSQSALRPEPPGDPRRQLSMAAPAPARRRPSAQRWARDHAAGEPSGPGQESITVQVTIGRVEVRAAPPAARASAAPRPSAGPSLADYLRHRSRSAGARP
jgi:hypothetical protein